MSKVITSLFLFFVLFLAGNTAVATAPTITLYPSADTWVHGTGNDHNDNPEGTSNKLRLKDPTSYANVLVMFPETDIEDALESNAVASATLQLYIETNYNTWGSGANLGVYRLVEDWAEGSATWACANDLNPTDNDADCDTEWDGGTIYGTATTSTVMQNSVTGWVSFDVTNDLRDFIADGNFNFGWLIKKSNSAANGRLDFTSREGTSSQVPRLVITIDPPHITSPYPHLIQLDAGIVKDYLDSTNSQVTLSADFAVLGSDVSDHLGSIDWSVTGNPTLDASLDSWTKSFSVSVTKNDSMYIRDQNNNPVLYYWVHATGTYDGVKQGQTYIDDEFYDTTFSGTYLGLDQNGNPMSPLDSLDLDGPQLHSSRNSTTHFASHYPSVPTCYDQAGCPSSAPEIPNKSTPDDCRNSSGNTYLNTSSNHRYLCWQNKYLFLTGYSAFEEITWNHHYCTSCGNYAPVAKYMENSRFFAGDSTNTKSYGVNLHRVFATGALRAIADETMPFPKGPGVTFTVKPGFSVNSAYKLKKYLDATKKNGIVVELTLFDSFGMQSANWKTGNPWYPGSSNNDMWTLSHNGTTCAKNDTGLSDTSAFPKFYSLCKSGNSNTDACADSDLNCLGWVEQGYVNAILNIVKTGNSKKTSYKNVFIEIMNEPSVNDASNTTTYIKWHNTVASWIKSAGFLVSVNPYPDSETDYTGSNCCPSCNSDSCNCTSCTTQYGIGMLGNVDLVSMHYHSWDNNGVCTSAKDATWRFQKPIIIDNDGAGSSRDNNVTVAGWAVDALSCLPQGRVHFNHLDESKYMPTSGTLNSSVCGPNPPEVDLHIDCQALDKLANAGPTSICSLNVKGYKCLCIPAAEVYCYNTSDKCSGTQSPKCN